MKFVLARTTILLCFVLLFPGVSLAQNPYSKGDILVRNVTLIDPTGKSGDRIVNILTRNYKLEIITEDKIASNEVEQVVDAAGGFVVGKLEIGQPPSFMILSSDPREDFRVMLDTKTYSTFAINDGHGG